jgi:hypothetical protein
MMMRRTWVGSGAPVKGVARPGANWKPGNTSRRVLFSAAKSGRHGTVIGSAEMLNGMAKLSDEQRYPLEALVPHPNRCAEAELLARGFSMAQLSGLVIDVPRCSGSALTSMVEKRRCFGWRSPRRAERLSQHEANAELALIRAPVLLVLAALPHPLVVDLNDEQ